MRPTLLAKARSSPPASCKLSGNARPKPTAVGPITAAINHVRSHCSAMKLRCTPARLSAKCRGNADPANQADQAAANEVATMVIARNVEVACDREEILEPIAEPIAMPVMTTASVPAKA